jgi:hypothetical protein
MKCPRIYKAKAINDRTLVIEFTNQEVIGTPPLNGGACDDRLLRSRNTIFSIF